MDKQKHMKASFVDQLKSATFIKIDGQMFRVNSFHGDLDADGGYELHFEDEESGEQHVNSLAELFEDMYEIEIFTLTRTWNPEKPA